MKAKFEFTATGFVIALILVGMFAFGIGYFITELQTEYSLSGTSSLSSYENFGKLNSSVSDINDASDIGEEAGVLDVIGSYFKSGYAALKVAGESIGLFNDMLDQANDDIPELSFFSQYIYLIILIALVLGVIITVLVKMRV